MKTAAQELLFRRYDMVLSIEVLCQTLRFLRGRAMAKNRSRSRRRSCRCSTMETLELRLNLSPLWSAVEIDMEDDVHGEDDREVDTDHDTDGGRATEYEYHEVEYESPETSDDDSFEQLRVGFAASAEDSFSHRQHETNVGDQVEVSESFERLEAELDDFDHSEPAIVSSTVAMIPVGTVGAVPIV